MAVQQDQGELTCNDFLHKLALKDLDLNLTATYTPQKDSIAERLNRIIVYDANVDIKWANCQGSFVVTAMETAVYCRNRSASKTIAAVSTNSKGTPYKQWCSQKSNISHLRL